jgi:hypothetical protein
MAANEEGDMFIEAEENGVSVSCVWSDDWVFFFHSHQFIEFPELFSFTEYRENPKTFHVLETSSHTSS